MTARFMTHAPILGQPSLPPMRHHRHSSSLRVGTPRTSSFGAVLTRASSGCRMGSFITRAPVSGGQSPALMLLHHGLATCVWSGKEFIVWGGSDVDGNPIGTGAKYNPVNNTWTPITTIGAPAQRSSHTAIWDGSRMIVWSGSE